MENIKETTPTVLIVDDMQENLMLLSDILMNEYHVKVAKNGKKALQIAQSGSVDLILLDIVMHELDGYEVCKILRNNTITHHIPIIFVTSNINAEDEAKGFELGAVDYITKPFSPSTVKARVKTHLSLSFQTKRLMEYEKVLKQEVEEKTKKLNALNSSLELKIQEEIQKNRQKDTVLQQQARLAALGEMMGNIAHQWRQPLTVITTVMSGLKIKNEFDAITSEDIDNTNEVVLKNADFLSKTIDSFRNFFKKDQEPKLFMIDEAILETIDIIQASYSHNHIQLEHTLQKQIHHFGNKNLFCQVVLNLLSNAKDILVERDIPIKKVWIECEGDDEVITIRVIDNALGVPEAIIEKIFDPYFTTKHQSQGTGLGLYMSQVILNNHFNGILEAANTAEGACFSITIQKSSSNKEVLEEVN